MLWVPDGWVPLPVLPDGCVGVGPPEPESEPPDCEPDGLGAPEPVLPPVSVLPPCPVLLPVSVLPPGSGDPPESVLPPPPSVAALCTPPTPALTRLSAPRSSLNSWPRKAAPYAEEAACPATSEASSLPVSVTAFPAKRPTALPAVSSATSPMPLLPSPPPTAPPTAPPTVAWIDSPSPNLSVERSPLATWTSRAPRSTPPSSSAPFPASSNAARAIALAPARDSIRWINARIAIRMVTCAAVRAAALTAAPTPVTAQAI
ncbi:hypothetical protein DFR68_104192 [Nocardia mexicana]|uniref:Uncharacterized protein n=1 Tax=Nocardia mexicana TaxID=279262 RepID=A0A370HAW0_9NOCA|nr:hypothetical protein DFR68_104192 [Nocardia mexicana]